VGRQVESAPLRAVSAVLVAGGVGVFPAGTRRDGDVQQVLRGIAYAGDGDVQQVLRGIAYAGDGDVQQVLRGIAYAGDGDVQQVLRGIAYAAGAFGCAGGTGLPATAPARAGVPRPHRPPITVAIGPRLQLPTEAASRRTVAAAADEIHRALAAHTAARRPKPE
jgi:hypothetical protein